VAVQTGCTGADVGSVSYFLTMLPERIIVIFSNGMRGTYHRNHLLASEREEKSALQCDSNEYDSPSSPNYPTEYK